MTRLPIPGQDDGTWGDILNAYLSVSLASDGTLKPNVVGTSQLQAGAVTSSNLSSSVQTSLNSANTALQLGGDLGGSNTAPTVSKLQGTTLNGSSPSNGQVLTYSTVASAWVPGTPSTTTVNDATTSSKGIVELAGDLGGTASSPTVVSTHLASALPLNQGGTGSTTQNFVDLSTVQTIGGAKTFSTAPVVPSSSFPESAVTNLTTDLSAKVTKAGDTMTGKLTVPSFQVTGGSPASGEVLTADSSGNATWGTPAAGAQALAATAVKTSAYNAAAGDFVPVDASGGSVTVTLPTTPVDKTRVGIKMINVASTNTTTIAAGGSDVFNKAGGATTLTLSLLNQGMLLQYASSTGIWYVQSDDLALSQLDGRYINQTSLGAASGVATLNSSSQLTPSQVPGSVVTISQILGVSVKNPPSGFGLTAAVGNGTTDDTSALQAIGQYCLSNGIPMIMPSGIYKVTSGLSFTQTTATKWVPGFKIIGAGMGFAQDESLYGTLFAPTAAVTGPVISVTGAANTDNSNKGQLNGLEFADFGILGQTGVGNGIQIEYWTNATFRNLLISACADGIKLLRQANGGTFGYGNGTRFDNCHLVTNTSWGIEMADAGAIIANINNCNIASNTAGGVKMAPGPATIGGTTIFTGNTGPALYVVAPTGASTATGPRCYGVHFESNSTAPAGTYSTDSAQVVIDYADTPVFDGCTFLGGSGQHSVKAGWVSTVTGLVAMGNRHYGSISVSAQRAFLFGSSVSRAIILDKEIFNFGGASTRATTAQAYGGTGNGSSPRGTAGVGHGTFLEGNLAVSNNTLTAILAVADCPKGARMRFEISTQGGSNYATAYIRVSSDGSAMALNTEFQSAAMAISLASNALQLTQTIGSTTLFLWTAHVVGAI